MAKLITKIGNILQVQEGILVHGCNAQGKMNKGLAKDLRFKYPGAYDAYFAQHESKAGLSIGSVVEYPVPYLNLIIANAITQKYYGNDPAITYVSYPGIERCFKTINALALRTGLPVHIPKIGGKLGNGAWERISTIIEETLHDSTSVTLWLMPESKTAVRSQSVLF